MWDRIFHGIVFIDKMDIFFFEIVTYSWKPPPITYARIIPVEASGILPRYNMLKLFIITYNKYYSFLLGKLFSYYWTGVHLNDIRVCIYIYMYD